MSSPLLAWFGTSPLMIAPDAKHWAENCLHTLAAHPDYNEMLAERAQVDDGFWPAADDWRASLRPYVVRDGILQIPIKGVLLHDFPFTFGSWATGYIYIRRAFERGMADPEVKGIALVCDSPGGHVAGNFELVDRMFAFRGRKPIRAFAHESAYSAAYSIASVADKIVVSKTGGVGSIGVVGGHIDVTGALDQAGIKITLVYAGKHKVDSYPEVPLSEDAHKRIQQRVDELYGVFVSTVTRNRPSLSERQVRATEALCYQATEALSEGLADEIGWFDDAVSAFVDDLSQPEDEDYDMTGKTGSANDAAPAAEIKIDADAIRAEASATARTDERQRISAIVDSDEAKGREDLARHFAFSTDMSPDAARAALSKSPVAAPPVAKTNAFDKVMSAEENPQVGPNAGNDGEPTDETMAAQAVALYAGQVGIALPKRAS